jgi:hypothetical protein
MYETFYFCLFLVVSIYREAYFCEIFWWNPSNAHSWLDGTVVVSNYPIKL